MHRHILIPRQIHVQTMLSTKLSIQIDTHIYQSPCESNCVAYAAAALILCMKEQHGKKRKNHRLNLNISFPSPSNANEHYGSRLEYFCIIFFSSYDTKDADWFGCFRWRCTLIALPYFGQHLFFFHFVIWSHFFSFKTLHNVID